MTTLTPFQIQPLTQFTSAVALSGRPITSDEPADGEALVYDSAIGQFAYSEIMTTDTDQTITGEKTFTGGIVVGAGFPPITQFDHGLNEDGGLITASGFKDVTINFNATFTDPPVVTVTSHPNSGNTILTMEVYGVNTTSFRARFNNLTNEATTEATQLYWMAVQ